MRSKVNYSELFRLSHLTILVCYTIFSMILVAEAFLMDWERWALVILVLGVVVSWVLHVRQSLTDNVRLWISSLLMMVTFFFYGSHSTSTFDLAPVMTVVIMIFTMTGVRALITLCQITYFLTFIYGLSLFMIESESFDKLVVSRIFLHIALIFMVGFVGRKIIERWGTVLRSSDDEIESLREGTRRLNDFLTNISHEIRTPVNAVIGLTGVCLEKEKDPEIRINLRSVAEAGHRVSEQISDILDYSEIETDTLAVSEEDYMLSSVVNDVVVNIEPLRLKDLELIIDVDASLPSVMRTDVVKLKRILWHLISNGLKYTKEGGVYVRITSEKRDYGLNLIIEVKDTGIGMNEEELECVYDDFYQADSGRTRSTSGLGLGLVIVNGFVTSLKGFMSIDSKPEKGTIVRVSIPQQIVDGRRCMIVRDPDRLVLGAWLHFEKYESPQVREYYGTMMRNLVTGLGIQVHRAESEEGFKKLIKGMHFTHLMLGREEYEDNRDIAEALSKDVLVGVVAEEDFKLPEGSGARIIPKPFYCFPLVTVLNMDVGDEEEAEGRMYCPGCRALVVDDEPMNLSVALGIFKRYGMSVFTAESGREAIDLTRANEYDIIFMDHMMPEMDGVEAMKIIRSGFSREGRNIPIVALTANAVSTAKEMFLREGFDGFVSKPVELSDLERVLKRVLPKNLVTYRKDTVSETAAQDGNKPREEEKNSLFGDLRRLGIDTEKGLHYCQYDREFYKTLLMQYGSDAVEKIRDAEIYYKKRDLENYAIIVHSIKSTSKMIGALSLSNSAKGLEEAAKAGNEGFLATYHSGTMGEFGKLTLGILSVFGVRKAEEESGTLEGDVMEFYPEGETP